jgi:hypothetical protein
MTKKATTKYRELIAQSKDKLMEEDYDLQTQKVRSSIEVQLAETKRDLASARKELHDIIRSKDYNIQDEIDKEAEIEAYESGIKKATQVLKSRF